MNLDDSIWQEIEGGYRVDYDVSVPLKRLEATNDKTEIESIFKELWNELHHQGDVGLASYLALPQLARIARQKNSFDWNVLGLCATIEQQRHWGKNPKLPGQYLEYYNAGMRDLKVFIIANLDKVLDNETIRVVYSALATFSGQHRLGKVIIEMDEGTIDEFLENYS
ncbi:MAG TPA: hypothetical protein VIU12_33065 [Chryseolinea sp.]